MDWVAVEVCSNPDAVGGMYRRHRLVHLNENIVDFFPIVHDIKVPTLKDSNCQSSPAASKIRKEYPLPNKPSSGVNYDKIREG